MSHDHHEHRHPFQPDTPEPSGYYQWLGVALNELLQERGIYSADELRAKIEEIESATAETHGAQIVARTWTDTDFRAALQDDATAAIRSLGIDPGYTEIMALENYAGPAQCRRLHLVLVLSALAARAPAGLVQEQGLSRPCRT